MTRLASPIFGEQDNNEYYRQVLAEGDPVQFEAVPQDSSDNPYYCSWFASLVWKGKRPPVDDNTITATNNISTSGRRGSIGSTGKEFACTRLVRAALTLFQLKMYSCWPDRKT